MFCPSGRLPPRSLIDRLATAASSGGPRWTQGGFWMSRRWTPISAAPAAAAAILLGGWAVSAGQPTPTALTLCGTGTVGANQLEGQSDQDHPDPSTFTANQQSAGTQCTSDN